MKPDDMNATDRAFYESTRYKLAASIFIACIGLMSLGFGLAFAGESDASRIQAENSNDDAEDVYTSLSSGYGTAYSN